MCAMKISLLKHWLVKTFLDLRRAHRVSLKHLSNDVTFRHVLIFSGELIW